jgi:hypothetical protein
MEERKNEKKPARVKETTVQREGRGTKKFFRLIIYHPEIIVAGRVWKTTHATSAAPFFCTTQTRALLNTTKSKN